MSKTQWLKISLVYILCFLNSCVFIVYTYSIIHDYIIFWMTCRHQSWRLADDDFHIKTVSIASTGTFCFKHTCTIFPKTWLWKYICYLKAGSLLTKHAQCTDNREHSNVLEHRLRLSPWIRCEIHSSAVCVVLYYYACAQCSET